MLKKDVVRFVATIGLIIILFLITALLVIGAPSAPVEASDTGRYDTVRIGNGWYRLYDDEFGVVCYSRSQGISCLDAPGGIYGR